MEEKAAGKENKEAQAVSNLEKRTAIKKRFATMPASIVFIPAGGRSGFVFHKLLLDLNKYVRKINNSAVFGDILEVKAKHGRIKKLCYETWEGLKDIIPRFHAFDPKHWADINETMDERMRLINRAAACVINPIDDNVAMLAMAIKVLSEKFNEYQAKSDFDNLEKIAMLFRKIQADLTDLMGQNGNKQGSNT